MVHIGELLFSVSFSVPTKKQFTVLLIKPDAVLAGKADEIVERVSCWFVEDLICVIAMDVLSYRWRPRVLKCW